LEQGPQLLPAPPAEPSEGLQAKPENRRWSLPEPQAGQVSSFSAAVDMTSSSKRFSHDLQQYSYIGIENPGIGVCEQEWRS